MNDLIVGAIIAILVSGSMLLVLGFGIRRSSKPPWTTVWTNEKTRPAAPAAATTTNFPVPVLAELRRPKTKPNSEARESINLRGCLTEEADSRGGENDLMSMKNLRQTHRSYE